MYIFMTSIHLYRSVIYFFILIKRVILNDCYELSDLFIQHWNDRTHHINIQSRSIVMKNKIMNASVYKLWNIFHIIWKFRCVIKQQMNIIIYRIYIKWLIENKCPMTFYRVQFYHLYTILYLYIFNHATLAHFVRLILRTFYLFWLDSSTLIIILYLMYMMLIKIASIMAIIFVFFAQNFKETVDKKTLRKNKAIIYWKVYICIEWGPKRPPWFIPKSCKTDWF